MGRRSVDSRAAAALEAKETLAKLGIDIEPFGGDTILVSSYPAMLANIDPAELLRHVVDGLLSGGKTPDRRDLLNDLLNMIACKAAVKAGDYLAPEEITALLEQRQHYQDTHHCPHGRPTRSTLAAPGALRWTATTRASPSAGSGARSMTASSCPAS